MASSKRNAVVLLSGGLDSATVLAMARHEGFACHALSFDYGQRHRCEIDAAKAVAKSMAVFDHRIVTIDLRAFGGSALTDDIAVPKDRLHPPSPAAADLRLEGGGKGVGESATNPTTMAVHPHPDPLPQGRGDESKGVGESPAQNQRPSKPKASTHPLAPSLPGRGDDCRDIPITYVPARNTIFLSFALAHAEVIGAGDIFIGVNAIDYSGYPDCRPEYIRAYEAMANLATKAGIEGRRLRVRTPLIELTKAQIIRRGLELGVDYSLTFSCYDPDPRNKTRTGQPCGHCDSCLLRAAGFREAGVDDPALRLDPSLHGGGQG